MKTPQALKALAALSQETRLNVFRLLVQEGPDGLTVGTIAERIDVTPPAPGKFAATVQVWVKVKPRD